MVFSPFGLKKYPLPVVLKVSCGYLKEIKAVPRGYSGNISYEMANFSSMKNTHLHYHQGSPGGADLQRQAVLQSYNKKEESTQKLLADTNSFASLPLYKTPPSVLKTDRPFNPFNRNLMERLENSTFSPTVFKHVISPSEVSSNEFRWTIEDVSRFTPARIEVTSVNHDEADLVDNETEQSAQEAIERYFSKVEIPSPWEAPRHCSSPLSETPEVHKSKITPSTSSFSSSATEYRLRRSKSSCPTSHASTQTCWSFPPVLPEEVEAVLKPYLQAVNSDGESEEESLSTSTLRRKLNFNKIQSGSDRLISDEESMSCDTYSLDGGFCSPASHFRAATPLPMLSPPDVSPILSCSNSTQFKLTSRLNFTNAHCDKDLNVKEEYCEELMSITETPVKYQNVTASSLTNIKHKEKRVIRIDNVIDNCNLRNSEIECNSQDTGYNTQSSNDKTNWEAMTAASEIMEIYDSANTSWTEPVLQACSTPTKDTFFVV